MPADRSKSNCGNRRRWSPWVSSPAGSHTTSTICSLSFLAICNYLNARLVAATTGHAACRDLDPSSAGLCPEAAAAAARRQLERADREYGRPDPPHAGRDDPLRLRLG